MPPSPSEETTSELGFTRSLSLLETIVETFKHGALPLEDALRLFEQGVGEIRTCQAELNRAKGQVEELIRTLQLDGEIVTRPFDAAEE